MKLSIVLSTQPASFSALAYKGKLEENIRKIKGLGYDGVELAVRDPELLNLEDIDNLLKTTGLTVPAIGTGQAFGEEGLSFTHPEKAVRKKAVERIVSQVHLAEHLNAVVIIGLIRGKEIGVAGRERAEAWFAEALTECASVHRKVRLAIEPINRYECELLQTVESGLRFLDRLKFDNVGLLLDTFHMNIEEPSIEESIIQAKDRLFHFHVADSNRWHPGAGHIDFGTIVETLDSVGYAGFLSAEILPEPDPDTAARKTIVTMRRVMNVSKNGE